MNRKLDILFSNLSREGGRGDIFRKSIEGISSQIFILFSYPSGKKKFTREQLREPKYFSLFSFLSKSFLEHIVRD